jgi:hypothetical protein
MINNNIQFSFLIELEKSEKFENKNQYFLSFLICSCLYFIFHMSGTEGSLRKSKRQHVPNPIYSAGINELKMVKFFIIFRRHTPKQRKKEKGKILNLKKIFQV